MYNNPNNYYSSDGMPTRARVRIGAHVAGENKTYVRQVTPLCTVPIQTTATLNIQLFPVPSGNGRTTGSSNNAQYPTSTASNGTSMDPYEWQATQENNNTQSPIRIRASHVGGHARSDRYEYDAASSLSTGSSGGSIDGRSPMVMTSSETDYFRPATSGVYMSNSGIGLGSRTSTGSSVGSSIDGRVSAVMTPTEMMTDYFSPVTSGVYMVNSAIVPASKISTESSAGSSIDGRVPAAMTSSEMMTDYSSPVTSGVYMVNSAIVTTSKTSTGSSAGSSIDGRVTAVMTSSQMMTDNFLPMTSANGYTSRFSDASSSTFGDEKLFEKKSTVYSDQMTSSTDLWGSKGDAAIQVTPVVTRGVSISSQTTVDSSTETQGGNDRSWQVNGTQTSSRPLERTFSSLTTSTSTTTSTPPPPQPDLKTNATGSTSKSVLPEHLQEEGLKQQKNNLRLQGSGTAVNTESDGDRKRPSGAFDTSAMLAAVEQKPDYRGDDGEEDDDDDDDSDDRRYKSKPSTFRFLDWDMLNKLRSLGREGCRRILVFKNPILVLMIKAACSTEQAGNNSRLLELMSDIAENCAKRLCLMQKSAMPNVTAKHMETLPLNDGRLTVEHMTEVSQVLGETVSVTDIAYRFQPEEPNVFFGTFVKDTLLSRRQYAIGSAGVVTVLTKKNKYATIEAFSEQLCQHIVKARPAELGAFDGDRQAGRASQVRRKHRNQNQLLLQSFTADPTIVVAEAARRCFVSIDDFLLFD